VSKLQDKLNLKKGNRGRTIFRLVNAFFLIIVMIMMIVPILKIVSDSLDGSGQYGMTLIPHQVTLAAYEKVFTNKELFLPLLVSFYTTIIGTIIGLLLATLGAYVLTRKEMPGNKFMAWFVFITMLFQGGLVPSYLLIKDLHLMNTLWAVMLPLSINVYYMILMRSFFETLPESLMEAAEIDGCTPMGIFMRVVLPLSKPALASVGLFYAVGYWNHFFNFVMYITDTNKYNFQVMLRQLILDSTEMANQNSGTVVSGRTIENAVVIVSMLPPMLLYPFCQKYFVQGVTLGSVKG
jgi:putative aldouronate transport system permease protein